MRSVAFRIFRAFVPLLIRLNDRRRTAVATDGESHVTGVRAVRVYRLECLFLECAAWNRANGT